MTDVTTGLRLERLAFSKRGLGLPVALFLGVVAAYGAAVATILAGAPWMSVILVPICGILVVMLFIVGHDACHQSFTSSPRLNRLIGRIAFLPALHAFSLWDREHNQRHHRFNNIKDLDYAWIPLSLKEFAQASPLQRLKYRFYRNPGGVLFYYLFEIWPQRKIFPQREIHGKISLAYVADSAMLACFLILYIGGLTIAGGWFGKSAVDSVTTAFLLPFLICNAFISWAIFVHHTHYAVPWYATYDEWKQGDGAIYGTVHVKFPRFVRRLILNIMEHNVHHFAPRVPLYYLSDMQTLAKRPDSVTWKFSIRNYWDVCARCKLFDYEASRWLDFNGRPTAELLRKAPCHSRSERPAGESLESISG
jgi:acyl-lipid omega-6 desaturase (Delta-12 desaturase)